jgi:hypothetical protein
MFARGPRVVSDASERTVTKKPLRQAAHPPFPDAYFHSSAPGCMKNGAAVLAFLPRGGKRACNA